MGVQVPLPTPLLLSSPFHLRFAILLCGALPVGTTVERWPAWEYAQETSRACSPPHLAMPRVMLEGE
jgi:hypothetical protein